MSTSEEAGAGSLFGGLKFWFSRAVPQREYIISQAQRHGGEIVPLEKQADVLIVDHARKNQPAGTHSYRFIEASIRNGALENIDDHAVGPAARVDRPVGSRLTAGRKGRIPFTREDDQFLWDQVEPVRRAGGPWKGNEIYKQLEQINPRHTFQSWRDRFVKHVVYQNRAFTGPALRQQEQQHEQQHEQPHEQQQPHEQPHEQQHEQNAQNQPTQQQPRTQRTPNTHRDPVIFNPADLGGFTAEAASELYAATRGILDYAPEVRDSAWAALAEENDGHSANEWKRFFNDVILPQYYKRHSQAKTTESTVAESGHGLENQGEEDAQDEDGAHRDTAQAQKQKQSHQPSTSPEQAEKTTRDAPAPSPKATHIIHQGSSPIPQPSDEQVSASASASPRPPKRPQTPPTSFSIPSSKRRRLSTELSPESEIPATPGQDGGTPLTSQATENSDYPIISLVSRPSPGSRFVRHSGEDEGEEEDEEENDDDDDDDNDDDNDDTSSVYQFDTAPNQLTENWKTGPDDTMSVFETAPSSPVKDDVGVRGRSRSGTPTPRAKLPSLVPVQVPASVIDLSSYELDAPASADETNFGHDLDDDDNDDSDDDDDDGDDENEEDEDEYAAWKARHRTAWSSLNIDPDDLDKILHLAIAATTVDFETADRVVKMMIDMYRLGQSAAAAAAAAAKTPSSSVVIVDETLLPDDVPGCWTVEDDECLRSGLGKHLKRVNRKHGMSRCETRIQFLNALDSEEP